MTSHQRRYWIMQLSGWLIIVLITMFYSYSFGQLNDAHKLNTFLKRAVVWHLLGVSISHLMRCCIVYFKINDKKIKVQIRVLITFSILFAIVLCTLRAYVLYAFNMIYEYELNILKQSGVAKLVFGHLIYIVFILLLWNCIYFIYHIIVKSQKQQLDALRLEKLVQDLELKTIKAHIKPHFIFNSLNGIRALVDENPIKAREAITNLSNILRSSLQMEKRETISLEKELEVVRDYLELEKMRFEDRLDISYEIDNNTLYMPVPPMMVQNLVENAIKHGISKLEHGGKITIISRRQKGSHVLLVQNSGSLDDEINLSHTQSIGDGSRMGFGLFSTINRLKLLYGEKVSFRLNQQPGNLVEAEVLIPFE